jgi:hypothetical protein
MADDRAQARREAATLLGVDIDHLSPADGLRIDMVSALRLVIDSEQASILSGGSADLGKLNVAVSSLIALLPGRELPEPKPVDGGPNDPRTIMWETYLAMRKRGELADPTSTYEGMKGERSCGPRLPRSRLVRLRRTSPRQVVETRRPATSCRSSRLLQHRPRPHRHRRRLSHRDTIIIARRGGRVL